VNTAINFVSVLAKVDFFGQLKHRNSLNMSNYKCFHGLNITKFFPVAQNIPQHAALSLA
jgi:hypothetical protein